MRLFRFLIKIDGDGERTFIVLAKNLDQAEQFLSDELYGYSFTIIQRFEEDRKVFIIS
jgi:hypothetical protein